MFLPANGGGNRMLNVLIRVDCGDADLRLDGARLAKNDLFLEHREPKYPCKLKSSAGNVVLLLLSSEWLAHETDQRRHGCERSEVDGLITGSTPRRRISTTHQRLTFPPPLNLLRSGAATPSLQASNHLRRRMSASTKTAGGDGFDTRRA